MKFRTISTVAALVCVVYAAPSMAFGLPPIPGITASGNSGASVNVDSLTQQQADLLVTVTTSLRNLSAAQTLMAQALKLDSAAAVAQSTGASLAAGNLTGKDEMKKDVESSLAVQQQINDKLAKGEALSADSKATFAKSLVPYGLGSAGMVVAGKKAADASQALTHTMDPTVLFKLGSLLYVAQEAPTLISSFGNATSGIVSFASAQGIDTSALQTAGANLGN